MTQTASTVIAIPTFNEAATIGAVLDDLLADGRDEPILVVDGGSTDGTIQVAKGYAAAGHHVRVLENPDRRQAAAVNLAAEVATRMGARTLVRVDAHARYPAGFVGRLLDTLARTGADSVTVPLIARGDGFWQTAAAALQRSWLGHGNAGHRSCAQGGWVDHGHHAAFRLSSFRAIGGYDPRFVANEDAEFDLRLSAAGGRIWLEPSLAVAYLPRATPRSLWLQMRRNGRWRVETLLKHRRLPALRQTLPMLATLGTGTSLAAGLVLGPAFAAPVAAYLLLVLAVAVACAGVRRGGPVALLAVLSHLGFGSGALERLARVLFSCLGLPAIRPQPGRPARQRA